MVTLFDSQQDMPAPVRMKPSAIVQEWRLIPRFLDAHYRLLLTSAIAPRTAERVVLIPGFGAGEFTLEPLRRYFLKRGIAAEHWGLGVNRGDAEKDWLKLIDKLDAAHGNKTDHITLVGWSMGGVIAREVARARPQLIKRVFTLGTPAIGGPSYTLAANFWGEARCEEIAQALRALDDERPIEKPVVAFFSKNDGVVSWPACIDRVSANVLHYEVAASHWAIGYDWQVWEKMHQLFFAEANLEDALLEQKQQAS